MQSHKVNRLWNEAARNNLFNNLNQSFLDKIAIKPSIKRDIQKRGWDALTDIIIEIIDGRVNTYKGISNQLTEIHLPESNSKMIKSNGGSIFGVKVSAIEGLFKKNRFVDDHSRDKTTAFGRAICDIIRNKFECEGFFTTDEIPGRYGLNEKDRKIIMKIMRKSRSDHDLVVLLAYQNQRLMNRITKYLDNYFSWHIKLAQKKLEQIRQSIPV